MRSGIDLKQRLAVGSLAMLLASGGCATMAPRAERYVAPPLGSTWVSMRRDTGSYGSTSVQVTSRRAEQTWQGKPVIAYESSEGTLLAHPHGAWIGQFKADTPVVTWDPPLSWEWPLEVGKTWTKDYSVTVHATNRTMPFKSTQKIEAYEDITVPAGTFKVFKVRTLDTFGNENLHWFSPELGIFVKQSLRRTAKHPAGEGTREVELISQTIKK